MNETILCCQQNAALDLFLPVNTIDLMSLLSFDRNITRKIESNLLYLLSCYNTTYIKTIFHFMKWYNDWIASISFFIRSLALVFFDSGLSTFISQLFVQWQNNKSIYILSVKQVTCSNVTLHFCELSFELLNFVCIRSIVCVCLCFFLLWISVGLFERVMCNFSRVNKSVLFKRFVRHRIHTTTIFWCNSQANGRQRPAEMKEEEQEIFGLFFLFIFSSLWEWANIDIHFFFLLRCSPSFNYKYLSHSTSHIEEDLVLLSGHIIVIVFVALCVFFFVSLERALSLCAWTYWMW